MQNTTILLDPARVLLVSAAANGRNPPWEADELILALDLYLRHGQLDDTDSRVVEVSRVLNTLPIHSTRPDAARFRNPNGVAMKLANFAALDPAYVGGVFVLAVAAIKTYGSASMATRRS